MPTYPYVCGGCGARLEISHGMNESPPATCAICGGALERVFAAPRLNLRNYSSPAAAKYARMSPAEEVAHMEAELESARLPERPPDPAAG